MEFAYITSDPVLFNVIKVLTTGVLAFLLGIAITPLWTHILYTYKIGIKIKNTSIDGKKLTYVNKLHAHKDGTPTMGGVIVWGSVILLVYFIHWVFPLLADLFGSHSIARMDFLSQKQTWLPLFALCMGGILGLIDDWMSVRRIGSNLGGGMRFIKRFYWLVAIAGLGAWWFYVKLGWDEIHIPGFGDFSIGWWYIPLFLFVIIYTAISSNETDGLDGLNGGILFMAFSVFAVLAFVHNKVDLAALCAAISGALLAFLWFNIPPARFFMGDTGAMSLGITLGVVALLTNGVIVLFIVTAIYILESSSVAIQLFSKRFFGKKVFLSAPFHHHLEAIGWPEQKIVMRAWVLTIVLSIIGLLVGLLGMGKWHV